MTGPLGLPLPASAHAGEVDQTMIIVHVLMGVLFVGWILFFLYVLWRFRRSRNPVASYTGATGKTSTYLEIAVAVAEGVLLVGFSIPLWAKRVDDFPPRENKESVVVRVVAEQFAWNIHYPGPDGKFGKTDIAKIDVQTNPLGLDREDPDAKDDIVTLNQLHLPVNKNVIIDLSSKDVIHSFNLKEMRVKQDAVPGLVIPLWFVPTVTSAEMKQKIGNPEFTYEIACAQLCGLGHYSMRGYVTIHTQDEYDAWLAEEGAKLSSEDSAWN